MINAASQTINQAEARQDSKRGNLILLLLLGLRRGVVVAAVLSRTLLIHLLEETKRRLLGLCKLLTDEVGVDGLVTSLALDGELTELSNPLFCFALCFAVCRYPHVTMYKNMNGLTMRCARNY